MRYRERLIAPLSWWILAGLFAVSILVAVVVATGPAWGLAAGLVCFAGSAGLLWAWGSVVEVTDTEFAVGRARIDLGYLGVASALDAEQARRRCGPEADARAYLVLRPYLATAVEVAVTDTDDPAPYWLISSRRPAQLVASLEDAKAARTPHQSVREGSS